MNLVKWDPFRDFLSLHDRLNRAYVGGGDAVRAWTPAVDIFERGDDLVIRAELPGVDKDDIEVRVEDGTLVLGGQRKRESEIKEEESYRLERSYGSFVRRFELPDRVNAGAIDASYKDGVLEIVLPKAEDAKPRKIKVQAA
jgi:HSP20 family protein